MKIMMCQTGLYQQVTNRLLGSYSVKMYSHHVIGKKNYPWKNKKFPPAN